MPYKPSGGRLVVSYKQLSCHKDQDAGAVGNWLRVKGRDLVLDFLERKCLQLPPAVSPRAPFLCPRREGHTTSFSTMGFTPSTELDSNVNMEFSRCGPVH